MIVAMSNSLFKVRPIVTSAKFNMKVYFVELKSLPE